MPVKKKHLWKACGRKWFQSFDSISKGEMVADGELMQEFAYYVDNQTLLDQIKCEGYGLTDLYVWQVERYNLMQDYGKNGAECNKVAMVLDSLYMMAQMKKNPEEYVKRLNSGLGMDQF